MITPKCPRCDFTLTQKQAGDLLRRQRRQCKICKREKDVMVIDHDHHIDKVKGAICESCFEGLNNFSRRVSLLRAAILYLRPSKSAHISEENTPQIEEKS